MAYNQCHYVKDSSSSSIAYHRFLDFSADATSTHRSCSWVCKCGSVYLDSVDMSYTTRSKYQCQNIRIQRRSESRQSPTTSKIRSQAIGKRDSNALLPKV